MSAFPGKIGDKFFFCVDLRSGLRKVYTECGYNVDHSTVQVNRLIFIVLDYRVLCHK